MLNEKHMIKGNLVEIVKNKMEVCGLEKTRRAWHAMSLFTVPLNVMGEKDVLWMVLIWKTTKYWHIENKLCPLLSGNCLRRDYFGFTVF